MRSKTKLFFSGVVCAGIAITSCSSSKTPPVPSPSEIEKASIEWGKYLTVMTGCNDCHTSGFAPSGGKIPEQEWLKGDNVGWRGPWGTTYPVNLRLFVQGVDETEWVRLARTVQARPPMPSYILHGMKEEELRDIYRFIRSLGPAGEAAPAYVPPGKEPSTPYFSFVPVEPKKAKASHKK